MKIQIDIFTGFLSSGKTTLINEVLQRYINIEENIVIVQCEQGEEELEEDIIDRKNITVERLSKNQTIDVEYMKEIIKTYKPNRIIIEHNGMAKIEELLDMLCRRGIRRYCIVNRIINVIDSRQFHMLMGIVGPNLISQISYGNINVLNYTDRISADKLEGLKREISSINKSGIIVDIEKPEDFQEYMEYNNRKSIGTSTDNGLALGFLVFVILFLAINIIRVIDLSDYMFKLQVLNTVFISILMEAFPFLLLGVFISSIIQLFVTQDMIIKYFPKNKIISFFVAIIGGMFFPVCDCAIVPVTSSLTKKGVPLHATVTFMLAAPIINPIVLMSTYYAFGYKIALARMTIGIIVATVTGIIFLIFPEEKDILVKDMNSYLCNCAYCNGVYDNDKILSKISSIFKHAGEEFFSVGKFLIIGAFITAMVQVFIPKNIFVQIGEFEVMSIILMMGLAFLFSVCSSSDAFIARSFSNQFSKSSIMGFMVFGAMLDIKNLLMLSESFSKRFIIKLSFILCNVAFSVLCFYHIIIQR